MHGVTVTRDLEAAGVEGTDWFAEDINEEAAMYALFTEVNADESAIEQARDLLQNFAAPRAREWGAKGGYWLAPHGGRGVSVVVFETEEEARKAADNLEIGKPPMPNAPAGVTVKSVEVREVLAAV